MAEWGHGRRRFAPPRPADVIANGATDADDRRIGHVRGLYFARDDRRAGLLHDVA